MLPFNSEEPSDISPEASSGSWGCKFDPTAQDLNQPDQIGEQLDMGTGESGGGERGSGFFL